jgi:hypothetical protein
LAGAFSVMHNKIVNPSQAKKLAIVIDTTKKMAV